MLMCTNKINMLANYIEEKKDKELYRWWAQYLESNEKYDQSLNYYKLAEDFSALVIPSPFFYPFLFSGASPNLPRRHQPSQRGLQGNQ